MELQSVLGSTTEAFKTMLKGVTDDMQMCILNCLQCHQVCERMVTHCLTKGGPHASVKHITTLLDCSQICAVSADLMLRESAFHPQFCHVCAEICARCARECEMLNDDSMMQMCIDVCQRCEESCRKMATQH